MRKQPHIGQRSHKYAAYAQKIVGILNKNWVHSCNGGVSRLRRRAASSTALLRNSKQRQRVILQLNKMMNPAMRRKRRRLLSTPHLTGRRKTGWVALRRQ